METRTVIDYLTLTRKVNTGDYAGVNMTYSMGVEFASDVILVLTGECGMITKVNTSPFYALSFVEHERGIRVDIGERLDEQGCRVVFSGTACRKVGDIVSTCKNAYNKGFKCTRIDFAFDLLNSGYEVSSVIDEYFACHDKDKGKSTGVIRSKSGDTLYVGSRKSARMLRVYDKGREQNLDINWLRFEAELKDYAALDAFNKVVFDDRYGVAVIYELLDLPDSPYGEAMKKRMDGYDYTAAKAPKQKANRRLWIETQVVPAFRKLVMENPMDALECIADIEQALLEAYQDWLNEPTSLT